MDWCGVALNDCTLTVRLGEAVIYRASTLPFVAVRLSRRCLLLGSAFAPKWYVPYVSGEGCKWTKFTPNRPLAKGRCQSMRIPSKLSSRKILFASLLMSSNFPGLGRFVPKNFCQKLGFASLSILGSFS
eukprot:34562_4